MKTIALTFLFISTSAFALNDCIDYPIDTNGPQEIKGKITSVSSVESFGECPDSVLLNDRIVVRLSQLREVNFESRCVYSNGNIAFACKK